MMPNCASKNCRQITTKITEPYESVSALELAGINEPHYIKEMKKDEYD